MSEPIKIIPYAIDRQIDYVKVFLDDFQLNAESGSASVYEYDSADTLIHVTRVAIPSEVWAEWSRDDNFIIEFVLDQLGFERLPDSPIHFPE